VTRPIDVRIVAAANRCLSDEVTAGRLANCAITQEGRATCWGEGKVATEPAPRGVDRLSVGDTQACGLKPNGEAVCWGEPMTWKPPPGPLRAVDVGTTTCAIRADGRLICVGETVINADHSLR